MDLTCCPLERLAAILLRMKRKSLPLYADLTSELRAVVRKQMESEQNQPLGACLQIDETTSELASILRSERDLIRPAVEAAYVWRWSGVRRLLDKWEHFENTGSWGNESTATMQSSPNGVKNIAASARPAVASGPVQASRK